MNCTHCGKPLDTQAIQQGACQYCGQTIPRQDTTGQGAASFGTIGFPAAPGTDSQSVYSWKDWPATNAPPSGPVGGAGQTQPTLPQTPPPSSAPWSATGSANDAPTLPGPLPFTTSAPTPTGTSPFGASAAPPGMAPSGGAAPPGAGAPPAQPQRAAPAAAFGAPPRYVPPTPARPRTGRRLALAGVIVLLALALFGGGLLFASSFNKASGSRPGASSPTQPTTSKPGTTPAGQPSPTTGAPSPTSAAPTPTQAAPTPTAPATKKYTDPGNLYTLQYPASWTAASGYARSALNLLFTGVRFSGGNAEFVILTTQKPPVFPTNGLAQVDDAFLKAMGAQNINGPSQGRIDGRTWTEESADTSGGKHTVIDSIVSQGRIYTLWYDAPKGEFSTDDSQFFTPMRTSFRFGA